MCLCEHTSDWHESHIELDFAFNGVRLRDGLGVGISVSFRVQESYSTGAPNENIVQNLAHKHSIVERTLVFKRQIKPYFYPLKIFHLFGFPS